MQLKDIEYIRAIAREGSFSAAAASCFISQPALSVCAGNDMIQPGGSDVVEEIAQALASEDKTENRGVRPYSQKMHIGDLQACAMHILGVILRCDSVKRILKREAPKAEALEIEE